MAALDLYGQSLAAYEAIGDRAEEARILAEIGWTDLRAGHPGDARPHFLSSVQAYTDVASVRGVGLSLIGLAAIESAENQPVQALQIAAAAEVYARQEGIVNVYSDETPGREFVDRARASLPTEESPRPRKSAVGSWSSKRWTSPGSPSPPRPDRVGTSGGALTRANCW